MRMRMSTLITILLALLALPVWAGGHSKAALRKEAKITMEEAQKTALAKEPGKIKSKQLEREKGRLIYSFDIKTADGLHEIQVDAITGDLVENTFESAPAEAKEKAADKKQKKRGQAAPNN